MLGTPPVLKHARRDKPQSSSVDPMNVMDVTVPTHDAVLGLLPFASLLLTTAHDSSSTEQLVLLASLFISIETQG